MQFFRNCSSLLKWTFVFVHISELKYNKICSITHCDLSENKMNKIKNFFSDNGYMIVRMIVYQIAMTIFGFSMSMACARVDSLLLLSSVVATGLYLFLLFFATFEVGQKDGIRIECGRLERRPLVGLWCSLCANALNFLLGILAVIGKFMISNLGFFERVSDLTLTESEALSPVWAANLYSVCDTVSRLLQCMYVGIAKLAMPDNVLVTLLMPIPAIIVCAAAYPLGIKFCSGSGAKKKTKSDRYR